METQDLNEIIKQQNEIIAVKDSKIGLYAINQSMQPIL